MHIPDGYLAPQTYGAAFVVMAPTWAVASRKLKKSLSRKQVPLLALGAAFSFVVMFLNVPVMGKMTAHPTGSGLVAIIVGPWAACIGISAALLVQAVPFGDGGITTFGANCLNLAFIMPFVSWGVFKLVAGRAPGKTRLWLASAAAGYMGIVAAAAAVGVQIGMQPEGFLPYSVPVALAAMLVPHLLIVGPIEAVVTAAGVGYIYRTEPWLVESKNQAAPPSMARRLVITLVVLVLLVPVGVLLPEHFGAGAAWAEWGAEELQGMFGKVPEGIARDIDFWRAPLPDYALPGREAGITLTVLMAVMGGLATIAVALGIGKLVSRGSSDVSS